MSRNYFGIELDFLSLTDKNLHTKFHCKTMLDLGILAQASTVNVTKLFIIPIILSYFGYNQNNTKSDENFLSNYCKNLYQRFKTVMIYKDPDEIR